MERFKLNTYLDICIAKRGRVCGGINGNLPLVPRVAACENNASRIEILLEQDARCSGGNNFDADVNARSALRGTAQSNSMFGRVVQRRPNDMVELPGVSPRTNG